VSSTSKPGKVISKSTCPKGASRKAKNCRLASGKSTKRGQQSIASDRAREIQEALIREHYLDGEATGVMDQATKSALTKYQNDNGWQTKIVPDSRALIKLGLGPSREGLLNPDSAALASPKGLSPEKEIPGGH
jgi:peptidoglycan hydrolase-like protein with peptidoglycan-binding domain